MKGGVKIRGNQKECAARKPEQTIPEGLGEFVGICGKKKKNNHRHVIHCLAVKRTTVGPTRQLDIRRNLFAFLNVRTYNIYDGSLEFQFDMNPL